MARVVMGVLLVGSVAWAQQGLILEPWRKSPLHAAAPVPALPAMPASGLGPSVPGKSVRSSPSSAIPVRPVLRWSPPVVELLVDPWAKTRSAAPAGSRWVPSSVEIVDPWAEARATKPRAVAHQPPAAPHSSIF